ncbi:MAG: phage integrase Arm DNA-binding domain-containing protein, partial [Gallionella sp.]
MPPRRKQARDLPDNLYPALDKRDNVLRYKYRDPRTGRQHGMGSDKDAAVADALALNAAIYASMANSRVANIATREPDTPMLSAVILKHAELCEARHKRGKLAANTITTKRSHGEAIRRALGHKPIGDVSVLDIAALLASYVDSGKDRAAQAVRSEAIEIWKTAISQGWIKENAPA